MLLPMPGSPPSSVTDPGTMPPPSTRSSSPIPVGCGRPIWVSMSPIWTGVDGANDVSAGVASGGAASSSTSVFHAPHPEHWPAHLGCEVPHSMHAWMTLVFAMPTTMTNGCDGEGTGLR